MILIEKYINGGKNNVKKTTIGRKECFPMYKRGIYTVAENKKIAKDVFLMVLEGDTQYITAPGQFINILVEGFYLRRPISICDWDDKTITIIYKVVGKGTEAILAWAAIRCIVPPVHCRSHRPLPDRGGGDPHPPGKLGGCGFRSEAVYPGPCQKGAAGQHHG